MKLNTEKPFPLERALCMQMLQNLYDRNVEQDMVEKDENKVREYSTTIHFEDSGETDNRKALLLLYSLMKIADIINYYPIDLVSDKGSAQVIKDEGFRIQFKTRCDPVDLRALFSRKCNIDMDVGI